MSDVQRNSLRPSIGEFSELFQVLQEDIERVYPYAFGYGSFANEDPSLVNLDSSERRSLVRAVFAYIEGNAYYMRSMLLEDAPVGALTPSHILALSEEQVEITNLGKATKKPLRIGALPLLKLTLNSLEKVYSDIPENICAGPGLEAFTRSTRVRDRLMHPKSLASLTVTDNEIRDVVSAFVWFTTCVFICVDRNVDKMKEKIRQLSDLAEEMRSGMAQS